MCVLIILELDLLSPSCIMVYCHVTILQSPSSVRHVDRYHCRSNVHYKCTKGSLWAKGMQTQIA